MITSLVRRLIRSFIFLGFLMPILCLGQEANFKVMVSDDVLRRGDTLEMLATYSIGNRSLPPATFAVTLKSQYDEVWQMRWPLINGEATGEIIFPDSIKPGIYHLMFAIQPRPLKVFGEVMNQGKSQSIKTVLSSGTDSRSFDLPVNAMGGFTIENIYFENELYVNFESNDKRQKDPPMVKIESWLDSAFTPVSYAVKQIVVTTSKDSNVISPARIDKNAFFNNDFSCFEANYAAKLKMRNYPQLSSIALHDSIYLPHFLIPGISLSVDLLNDSSQLSKRSLYDVLQQIMPGAELTEQTLQVALENQTGRAVNSLILSEWMAVYKGSFYRLWSDGLFNAYEHMTQYPDGYATIKIINPHVFPGIKGSQPYGIIAIFERKYPFSKAFPYNYRHKIRGYTPQLYALPINPVL